MLAAAALCGCGGTRVAPKPSLACASAVRYAALPSWARSGFTDPGARMRYVLGTSGRIVAIFFAYPMLSPPPKDHSNKILWVARPGATGGGDLHIAAQRVVGGHPAGAAVRRTVVGGPGPSIINLPAVGCWRLTLGWSREVDHLDLSYVADP